MTYATVRAAAEHVARTGTITPHQLAAFTALWESMTDAQRQEFTDLWRAEGSPAAAAPDTWLAPALKIIREFEGCHLQAYLCPANVWTIGWGTTTVNGAAVRNGDKISQALADELLTADVRRFHAAIVRAIPMAARLSPAQQAALVSWTYNVGVGAMQDSTLRRRLLAGDDPNTVAREELPRWDKANGKPLAGLTRRRAAEVALFTGVQIQQEATKLTPGSAFSAKITPHFTLGEFALGDPARRFVAQHQVDTATELATFLERVRAQFGGKRITITSGYRPAAINRAVGGASGSEHLYDAPGVGAVDFYVDGADIRQVQDWCDREWPCSLGYGAPKGFVHLGIRKGRPRARWNY